MRCFFPGSPFSFGAFAVSKEILRAKRASLKRILGLKRQVSNGIP